MLRHNFPTTTFQNIVLHCTFGGHLASCHSNPLSPAAGGGKSCHLTCETFHSKYYLAAININSVHTKIFLSLWNLLHPGPKMLGWVSLQICFYNIDHAAAAKRFKVLGTRAALSLVSPAWPRPLIGGARHVTSIVYK